MMRVCVITYYIFNLFIDVDIKIAINYKFIISLYNAIMISYDMNKNLVIRKTIKNEDVYELLKKIPVGKVTTYGDLAKALGNPSASRIVGKILGQNPNPIQVPCHRVVMSNGKLGGYAYGQLPKRKDYLKKRVCHLPMESLVNS